MSQETLKVNVTFPLEVPVLYDSAGRRRSIPDHVAGYIDDYMTDLRISELWKKSNWSENSLSNGAEECDMEMYDRITSEKTAEMIADSQRRMVEYQIEFEKNKEEECQQLYNCSWSEFRTLKWGEQAALRELNGVYWKDGKWVKA